MESGIGKADLFQPPQPPRLLRLPARRNRAHRGARLSRQKTSRRVGLFASRWNIPGQWHDRRRRRSHRRIRRFAKTAASWVCLGGNRLSLAGALVAKRGQSFASDLHVIKRDRALTRNLHSLVALASQENNIAWPGLLEGNGNAFAPVWLHRVLCS